MMAAHLAHVLACMYARTRVRLDIPETKRLNGGKTDGRTDGGAHVCVCMCPRRICVWDPSVFSFMSLIYPGCVQLYGDILAERTQAQIAP